MKPAGQDMAMKPVVRELALRPAGRDLAMKPVLGGAIKPWTGVLSPSQAHHGGVVARAIKSKVLHHTE